MLRSSAVALAYILTGRLGMLVAIPPGNVTAVWIPSGIAITALLISGPRIWPGIWFGSFLVNLWFFGDLAGPIDWFLHGSMAAGIATGSTLQALALLLLLRRRVNPSRFFDEGVVAFRFVAASGIACLMAPLIGTLSLGAGGLLSGGEWPPAVATWWLGDLAGIVLVTPLWLGWKSPRRPGRSPVEALGALATLLLAGALIFASPHERVPLFVILPIMVWIAFRFGPREITLAVLITSAMATLATTGGLGPFSSRPMGESLLLVQAFVMTVATSMFALSATVAERQQAQERLAGLLSKTHERLHETESHREWSEARFRTVVEGISYGVILADDSGHIMDANSAARKMFALPPDVSLVGQPLSVLVPERLRDDHQRGLARFRETGRSRLMGHPVEMAGRKWNGQEFPVELCLATWTEGPSRCLAGLIYDLTDRKHAEEDLRRRFATEKLLEEIGSAANHARTAKQAFQFAAARLCEMAGWPVSHVYWIEEGPPPALLPAGIWHTDDAGRCSRFMEVTNAGRLSPADGLPGRVFSEGRSIRTTNIRDSLSNDRAHAAVMAGLEAAFAFPVLVENKVVAVFEFFSREDVDPGNLLLDIGSQIGTQLGRTVERQRAEENVRRLNAELELRVEERTADLRRSNDDLQQFAYVASHDLQEPLRMIASYAGLIQRRYKDHLDVRGAQFLQFTVEGAQRARSLIEDLLAYSQVGLRGTEFVPTECGRVLDEALANLRLAIEETRAKVVRGPLPIVMGDPGQLVLLFQNLVANAIKFRRQEPPVVEVTSELVDEDWVISFRDNGIGIDPQHAQKIFVIFQRLHSREEYPGTGIGLAICKKIVERHGGAIRVESTPESGSVFIFTLPKKQPRRSS